MQGRIGLEKECMLGTGHYLIGNLSIDDERHDDDVRYPRRIGSSKQCAV